MSRQGGLGRGLASLIPKKKTSSQKTKQGENNQSKEEESANANYFGGGVDYLKKTGTVKLNEIGEKQKRVAQPGDFKMSNLALKSIMEVPSDKISPNPHQPRVNFDKNKLSELADSIKEHGILQPLVVSLKSKDEFELIAGERRLEASKMAGLERVPVILKKVNNQTKLELALIENIQRHNLNPIEEARGYKKMQDVFSLTQNEVAKKVGKSRSTVANSLRLLSLPVEIQKVLAEGGITEGHARSILAISNPEKRRALFELILKDKLSVRQTERKVREITVSGHQRKIKEIDPEIKKREEELSQALGTKVKIKKNKKGGQVLIDFYSKEELEALLLRMSKE